MFSSNNSNPDQKIFCKHDPNKFSCEQALCSNLSVPTFALPVLQLGFRAETIDQELTKTLAKKEKQKLHLALGIKWLLEKCKDMRSAINWFA